MGIQADIKLTSPTYNGTIDISWDETDPKKSLHLKTDSLFKNKEFDTKYSKLFFTNKTLSAMIFFFTIVILIF